jgi:hypothetical protein
MGFEIPSWAVGAIVMAESRCHDGAGGAGLKVGAEVEKQ